MKYNVWQVGWQSESKVVEVDGGDECPACKIIGRLPADEDAIVMAYQPVDGGEVTHRRLKAAFFGLAQTCRKATPEEIVYAEETARLLQEKKIEPYVETSEEAEAAKKMREVASKDRDLIVGGFLSTMTTSPLARAMGNSLVGSWAARKGMELGRQAVENKARRAAEAETVAGEEKPQVDDAPSMATKAGGASVEDLWGRK